MPLPLHRSPAARSPLHFLPMSKWTAMLPPTRISQNQHRPNRSRHPSITPCCARSTTAKPCNRRRARSGTSTIRTPSWPCTRVPARRSSPAPWPCARSSVLLFSARRPRWRDAAVPFVRTSRRPPIRRHRPRLRPNPADTSATRSDTSRSSPARTAAGPPPCHPSSLLCPSRTLSLRCCHAAFPPPPRPTDTREFPQPPPQWRGRWPIGWRQGTYTDASVPADR
mmetsp:Transcript_12514/g.27020  ORF Transcript_12514/g.27020 Transcript_12514/m.27020 type:complete len:224 (-) Transcript_12514:362-1033(-)